MLRVRTIASGSSGNCTYVDDGHTRILIDAGVSLHRIATALDQLGTGVNELDAILLTHEHSDHISGLTHILRSFPLPLYATEGTAAVLCYRFAAMEDLLTTFHAGDSFQVGTFSVTSFPTSHDTKESCGYILRAGGQTFVECTDLGTLDDTVRKSVEGCDMLLAEADYDEDMLLSGSYPLYLKKRILGEQGHLSNAASAELVLHAFRTGCRDVVLAHLSAENNRPNTALETVRFYLARNGVNPDDLHLEVAPRYQPGNLHTLEPKNSISEDKENAIIKEKETSAPEQGGSVMSSYREAYEKWLNSPYLSEEERAELRSIEGNEEEIEDRFYSQLEFGTAGLRGIMAVGLNRMNIHIIRHTTQAFAEVILAEGEEAAAKGVAICHDCRNHSREFAEAAASVMVGNGIPVRIFESLRPTPELSFAVREYGCIAGLNITASHNPKEYNGYKVYWADGAQLPPKHAAAIADRMKKLDVFTSPKSVPYEEALADGRITLMGKETDEKFLSNVMAQVNDPQVVRDVADTFKMVYTPFHGTGYKLIPEALRRLGMKHVLCEPKQMVVDGNFPTVVSPNPENPEGFYLAVDLAKENDADFILGSDPDADRVGIMVRRPDGEYVTITGNQTGVLLLDYVIGAKKRAGTMPEKPVALKTIVTTEMARKVAETNGVACYDTFTGFKFMAEKKNELEAAGQGKVIFSYEESYGYMMGDYVRDKDAVTASVMLTEMACWYAKQHMTLYDALQALYKKYGCYLEKTVNLVMPGLDGLEKRRAIMDTLRHEPPADLEGTAVSTRKDYESGIAHDCTTGAESPMELKGSNVLRFELADGTTVLVRPSGTEPKVKVYILTKGSDMDECRGKIAKYENWAQKLNA